MMIFSFVKLAIDCSCRSHSCFWGQFCFCSYFSSTSKPIHSLHWLLRTVAFTTWRINSLSHWVSFWLLSFTWPAPPILIRKSPVIRQFLCFLLSVTHVSSVSVGVKDGVKSFFRCGYGRSSCMELMGSDGLVTNRQSVFINNFALLFTQ